MGVKASDAREAEAKKSNPGRRVMRTRSVPQPGDVVASQTTARADEYAICIVPDEPYAVAERYREAIETVRQRASLLNVDGWYTADHTHFVRVASRSG